MTSYNDIWIYFHKSYSTIWSCEQLSFCADQWGRITAVIHFKINFEDDILCALAMYSFIWDSLYTSRKFKFELYSSFWGLYIYVDFNLRNQKTKNKCKETTQKYWFLQKCLTHLWNRRPNLKNLSRGSNMN